MLAEFHTENATLEVHLFNIGIERPVASVTESGRLMSHVALMERHATVSAMGQSPAVEQESGGLDGDVETIETGNPNEGRYIQGSKEYEFPVSETYFMKLLREHYKVIMHKHKGFSKCNCCHYYKEQLKKKGSVIDRIKLKKERAQHYALIYAERVEYHTLRRHAQQHPDKMISIIVDSCSKWKTELPRFTRELKLGKFSAHGNSLCTCLVHQNKEDTRNPGGAFNYFIDDAVKGGGNVTAEVIWRTLCKLQNLREIWAEELHVQLDNTTKDNKNHTVFAFLAWLVQSGNFHKVTVSFLPVGHTHEDIDALFGVIVRFLRGVPVTYTHEELRQQVDQALLKGNRTSWHPTELPEVVRGTHDWDRCIAIPAPSASVCRPLNSVRSCTSTVFSSFTIGCNTVAIVIWFVIEELYHYYY